MKNLVMNLMIVLVLMIVGSTIRTEETIKPEVIEYEPVTVCNVEIEPVENEEPVIEIQEEFVFSRNLSEEDKYLLAKIAMAEAEGESFETKVLVIETVLNRVDSQRFPNTVEEVIFQSYNGTYQFSPVMPGGRWWRVEPNEECWHAVNAVDNAEYDISEGALYFEAVQGESWHSRNLEFICKSGKTSFYK